eukprot:356120-Chlamydomonas_euryale.AAC.11
MTEAMRTPKVLASRDQSRRSCRGAPPNAAACSTRSRPQGAAVPAIHAPAGGHDGASQSPNAASALLPNA